MTHLQSQMMKLLYNGTMHEQAYWSILHNQHPPGCSFKKLTKITTLMLKLWA